MPKKLHRSLRVCLSKLKKFKTLSLPNTPRTNSLLSACKYPKTPSFSADRHAVVDTVDGDTAATLSDVDRFLFENFHSLYLCDDDESDGDDDDDESADRSPTPREAIRPSNRFFVSPGTSNSLADEARTSTSLVTSSSSSSSSSRPPPSADPDTAAVPPPGDSVAVMTFSKDPYADFRRSMQDMVASRHAAAGPGQQPPPLDWDFMEELLFCYLELNDRSVHKHVLRAFTDLTVSFRRRGAAPGTAERRRGRRKVVAPAAQEKGKDFYYYEKRKHMGT